MILSSRYRSYHKPPPSAVLNGGHPLSKGLKICVIFNGNSNITTSGSLSQSNYADLSNPLVGLNSNTLNITTVTGFGVVGAGGPQRGIGPPGADTPGFKFNKLVTNGVSAFTIFVRATEKGDGGNPSTVLMANTAGPVYQTGLDVEATAGTPGWQFYVTNNSASTVRATPGWVSGSESNLLVDAVGVYDGANAIFYGNGRKMASSAQTGTVSTSSTQLSMYTDASNFGSYQGTIVCAMVWTRALSAAEVASLTVAPYQMFYTPARYGFGSPAAGMPTTSIKQRRTSALSGTKAGSRQMIRSW